MKPVKVVKKVKPAKTATKTKMTIACFSRGSGMTAGLEMWSARVSSQGASETPTFLMYDRSPDGRFASDVVSWNDATVVAGSLTSAALDSFTTAVASA